MHIYILLLIMAFTFTLFIISLLKESYVLFMITTLLSFILAGTSMVIHIPTSTGISSDIFSDDISRVFFILFGSLNIILTIIYKFHSTVNEQSEFDKYSTP